MSKHEATLSLQDTMRRKVCEWPMLYADPKCACQRSVILGSLFLTIGNGYDWHDGGLRENPDSRRVWKLERRREMRMHPEKAGRYARPSADVIARALDPASHGELARVFAESDAADRPPPSQRMRFYPLCEYSRACTVPDDVRPDWLCGVGEALGLILTYDDGALDDGRNLKIARGTLNKLVKRFGPQDRWAKLERRTSQQNTGDPTCAAA